MSPLVVVVAILLFYVLLGVKMPAILVETSFLSHAEEEAHELVPGAEVVRVSAKTGAGLEELRTAGGQQSVERLIEGNLIALDMDRATLDRTLASARHTIGVQGIADRLLDLGHAHGIDRCAHCFQLAHDQRLHGTERQRRIVRQPLEHRSLRRLLRGRRDRLPGYETCAVASVALSSGVLRPSVGRRSGPPT